MRNRKLYLLVIAIAVLFVTVCAAWAAVLIPYLPNKISLEPENTTLNIGESLTIQGYVFPIDTGYNSVEWTYSSKYLKSSSTSRTSTNYPTFTVTAIAPGDAVVIARSTQVSDLEAKCNIRVIGSLAVTGVKLDKAALEMLEGEQTRLTATITPEYAENKNVTWASDNPSVARVSDTGLVEAVGAGTTRVTVSTEDGGYTAVCEVKVVPHEVTGVEINKISFSLKLGQTEQLKASVFPDSAAYKDVSWKSSNPAVASVSDEGVVRALSLGSAEITAITRDGGFTATCACTILPWVVSGVNFGESVVMLSQGEDKELTVVIKPDNATNKKVTYLSGNSSVAAVSPAGVITAVSPGVADITVTTEDGGYTAACIAIVEPLRLRTADLDISSASMNVGSTRQLNVTLSPPDADDKKLWWSSNNPDAATVSSSGLVTAVGNGEAEITVMSESGEHTAACAITVSTPVSGITLDKNALTMTDNTTVELMAAVLPENAAYDSVSWRSSDESIISLKNTKGNKAVFLASGVGTATISAVTDGDITKTASCKITVTAIENVPFTLKSVSISGSATKVMRVGTEAQLEWSLSPESAADTRVSFSSSNEAVATVSDSGVVRMNAYGEATITLTVKQGSNKRTAACKVQGAPLQDSINMYYSSGSWRTLSTKDLIVLDHKSVSLKPGASVQLDAAFSSSSYAKNFKEIVSNITKKPLFWVSTDDNVARITLGGEAIETSDDDGDLWNIISKVFAAPGGKVTGVSSGTATIYAILPYYDIYGNCTGIYSSCTVTVSETGVVPAAGVVLDRDDMNLVVGEEARLTAEITPANASNQALLWTSDAPAVAAVSSAGDITPKANGTANITVTTQDGKYTDSCKVNVTTLVDGVALDRSAAIIEPGTVHQLTANTFPSTATDQTITWQSDNPAVAAISDTGEITAVKDGFANITAATNDGGYKAHCSVMVRTPIAEAVFDPAELTVKQGEEYDLRPMLSLIPPNPTNGNLLWGSGNISVAIVSDSGLMRAISPGMSTIGVITEDGCKSALCRLTVTPPIDNLEIQAGEVVTINGDRTVYDLRIASGGTLIVNGGTLAVTGSINDAGGIVELKNGGTIIGAKVRNILINANGDNYILAGESRQLAAEISPSYAPERDLLWESSDPSAAEVDANGLVTAKLIDARRADVTITASARDGGGAVGDITLTVTRPPVTSISVVPAAIEAAKGGTVDLYEYLNIVPSMALKPSKNDLSWSSDNPDVTVNGGVVTMPDKETEASITVTYQTPYSDEQNCSAACRVYTPGAAQNVTLRLATKLEGRPSGGASGKPEANIEKVTLEIYDASNALIWSGAASADISGTVEYTVENGILNDGDRVQLWIKGERYLAALESHDVAVTSGVWNVELAENLKGGDADQEGSSANKVNIFDFSLLRRSVLKNKGESDFDYRADFNSSDRVDIHDFAILRKNILESGAQRPAVTRTASLTAANRNGTLGEALNLSDSVAGSSASDSSGGCNAGWLLLSLLGAIPFAVKKIKGKR
ncbi:MAG: Ig-like domain-containing protein [Synergistaceae bacterium]|nr:Ig-like domain-containing protein [Synergistaceae bacterium]